MKTHFFRRESLARNSKYNWYRDQSVFHRSFSTRWLHLCQLYGFYTSFLLFLFIATQFRWQIVLWPICLAILEINFSAEFLFIEKEIRLRSIWLFFYNFALHFLPLHNLNKTAKSKYISSLAERHNHDRKLYGCKFCFQNKKIRARKEIRNENQGYFVQWTVYMKKVRYIFFVADTI